MGAFLRSLAVTVLAVLAALVIMVTLPGCGGGGDDEERKDGGPVDCKARPELCT